MLKKSTSWCVLIYGILLVGLGYLGYTQTESKLLLYSGIGCGFLLILSALALFARRKGGGYTALAITAALTATYASRFSENGRGIPAIMAVLSGGMLIFLLALVARWKKN